MVEERNIFETEFEIGPESLQRSEPSEQSFDGSSVDFVGGQIQENVRSNEPSEQSFDGSSVDFGDAQIEENVHSNDPTDTEFDTVFSGSYAFQQKSNGDRCYLVDDTTVHIQQKDLDKLHRLKNSAATDSSFVSILLESIFTKQVLKQSSAGGQKSNYNKVSHDALDPVKLKFLEDLFGRRVKYNGTRKKHFKRFINTKCNNLRRT